MTQSMVLPARPTSEPSFGVQSLAFRDSIRLTEWLTSAQPRQIVSCSVRKNGESHVLILDRVPKIGERRSVAARSAPGGFVSVIPVGKTHFLAVETDTVAERGDLHALARTFVDTPSMQTSPLGVLFAGPVDGVDVVQRVYQQGSMQPLVLHKPGGHGIASVRYCTFGATGPRFLVGILCGPTGTGTAIGILPVNGGLTSRLIEDPSAWLVRGRPLYITPGQGMVSMSRVRVLSGRAYGFMNFVNDSVRPFQIVLQSDGAPRLEWIGPYDRSTRGRIIDFVLDGAVLRPVSSVRRRNDFNWECLLGLAV